MAILSSLISVTGKYLTRDLFIKEVSDICYSRIRDCGIYSYLNFEAQFLLSVEHIPSELNLEVLWMAALPFAGILSSKIASMEIEDPDVLILLRKIFNDSPSTYPQLSDFQKEQCMESCLKLLDKFSRSIDKTIRIWVDWIVSDILSTSQKYPTTLVNVAFSLIKKDNLQILTQVVDNVKQKSLLKNPCIILDNLLSQCDKDLVTFETWVSVLKSVKSSPDTHLLLLKGLLKIMKHSSIKNINLKDQNLEHWILGSLRHDDRTVRLAGQ